MDGIRVEVHVINGDRGSRRARLYVNYEECPAGLSLEDHARQMVAKASEQFEQKARERVMHKRE